MQPVRPLVPTRVGRYELLGKIAAGGMATVYLAREARTGPQPVLPRPVALKLIHDHLADDRRFIEMFLDEARIAARIGHPNVCTVLDFGRTPEGLYYLAMEYLLGETVGTVLRELASSGGPEPTRIALAAYVCAEAAEGLHAAHELRGADGQLLHVVHRDVSPQNVFINYDGSVRLVDFGIARAVDRSSRTQTGSFKGTAAYMAPETMRGETVDRRADVWSLGVLLWEMLTLQRLFRRDNDYLTLLALQQDEVPPPSTLAPDLPAELEAIVMRALQRDRDRRYATAREMARDLSVWMRKTPGAMGRIEVAEWMERRFGARLERKRAALSTALRVETTSQQIEPVAVVDAALAEQPTRLIEDLAEVGVEDERTPVSGVQPQFDPVGPIDAGPTRVEAVAADHEAAVSSPWGSASARDEETGARAEQVPDGRAATKVTATGRARRLALWMGIAAALGAGSLIVGLAMRRREPSPTSEQPDARPPSATVRATPSSSSQERPESRGPHVVATSRDETPFPAPPPVSSSESPMEERSVESEPAAEDARASAPGGRDWVRSPRPTGVSRDRGSRAATTPSAERGIARVSVGTTGGWASIHGPDGRVLCEETPCRFELAPGTHTLRVRPGGTGPLSPLVVRVRSGDNTIRVDLAALAARRSR
ncbi:MAG: serine/threonine protein kinase [Myxococcota bacterium]|nr:serine/threonine protein kinase [Myxococcota bacterium]MDW8363712.1 serine/threonine-protein kinase [Myxococcales bacterium]